MDTSHISNGFRQFQHARSYGRTKEPKMGSAGHIQCCAHRFYKKLSYCWETVRRESMPRIAEMDVEMTT